MRDPGTIKRRDRGVPVAARTGNLPPTASHASHSFAVLAPAPRPAHVVQGSKTRFFDPPSEKKSLTNPFRQAFSGSGWAKIRPCFHHSLRGFGRVYMRYNPAVFWQTKLISGLFSTGTKKRGLSGFPGIYPDKKSGKRSPS